MDDVSELDEATFRLVARLTLEDIEEMEAETNSDDDFAVAIRVHKREVEQALVGSMPRPAANSATDEAETASNSEAEEEFDADDTYILRQETLRSMPRPAANSATDDVETASNSEAEEEFDADDEAEIASNSEAEEELDADVEPEQTSSVECVVCREQGCESVFECPFRHNYCRQCMLTMVEHGMKDESLFPPRCCNQEVTLRNISGLLTTEQASAFSARQMELSSTNPSYCHDPRCSTFLGRTDFHLRENVACSKCNKETCILCKGAGHEQACANNVSSRELIRLVRENNWQECNRCGRIVERIEGLMRKKHVFVKLSSAMSAAPIGAHAHALTREQGRRRRRRSRMIIMSENRNAGVDVGEF